MPKATLNNEFNDDYEPVRCAINTQDEQAESSMNPMTAGSMMGGGGAKKKRKLEQINYQKQVHRGSNIHPTMSKGNILGMQSQMSSGTNTTGDATAASDRHQEYKIRTVKSLANAYNQQQQASQQYFKSRANQAQTTKNGVVQNTQSSTSKFIGQHSSYAGMNATNYEKQRHSLGPSNLHSFNGNSTQEVNTGSADDPRNKSPVITKNAKFINQKQMSMPPQNRQQTMQQSTEESRYINQNPRGLNGLI